MNLKSACRWVNKLSVLDWLMVLIVLVIGFVIEHKEFSDDFEPRYFSDIGNPKRTNTFPGSHLMVAIFVVGGILLSVIWATVSPGWSILGTLAAYYFAIGLGVLISSAIKKLAGRPRPDTLAQCGGDGSYRKCSEVLEGWALIDQFQSYPSGHSSNSMAAGMFLTMILTTALPSLSMASVALKLLPFLASIFIGVSRILDRAHHVDDVLAGWLIGAVSGYVSFITLMRRAKPHDGMRAVRAM